MAQTGASTRGEMVRGAARRPAGSSSSWLPGQGKLFGLGWHVLLLLGGDGTATGEWVGARHGTGTCRVAEFPARVKCRSNGTLWFFYRRLTWVGGDWLITTDDFVVLQIQTHKEFGPYEATKVRGLIIIWIGMRLDSCACKSFTIPSVV